MGQACLQVSSSVSASQHKLCVRSWPSMPHNVCLCLQLAGSANYATGQPKSMYPLSASTELQRVLSIKRQRWHKGQKDFDSRNKGDSKSQIHHNCFFTCHDAMDGHCPRRWQAAVDLISSTLIPFYSQPFKTCSLSY